MTKNKPLNVILLGAGGAIGNALLARYASANPNHRVLATHRQPVSAIGTNVKWTQCDYSRDGYAQQVYERACDQFDHVDRFVCTSGMLHTGDPSSGPAPEKRLSQINAKHLSQSYNVNAAAPLEVFAKLEPLLKVAVAPRAVFLSALVGSISDNQLGGWYAYRMSKAALNMGVRCASIEAARWRNDACVIAVHPGTTHSELSRPFVRKRPNVQSSQTCAAKLYELTESLQPEQNGEFYNQHGVRQRW